MPLEFELEFFMQLSTFSQSERQSVDGICSIKSHFRSIQRESCKFDLIMLSRKSIDAIFATKNSRIDLNKIFPSMKTYLAFIFDQSFIVNIAFTIRASLRGNRRGIFH